MQDLRHTALESGGLIDTMVARGLDALARQEPIEPATVRLLLRRYAMTGMADLEEPLGSALALALDVADATRPDWLLVMVEASSVSEDVRLVEAARAMEAGIRRGWPAAERAGRPGFVAHVTHAIDACLRAADLHVDDAARHVGIAAAVDELERIIGPRYRPGEGLLGAGGAQGDVSDHIGAASALLTAYDRTGRLPYSMLAEELMRFAWRTWLSDSASEGLARPLADSAIVAVSEAVGVLCRMAALHEDEDYRTAAVIAPDSNYASEAAHLLNQLAEPTEMRGGVARPDVGIALLDWLALQRFSNDPHLQ